MHTVNEILDRFERDDLPKLGPRTRQDYVRHMAVLRRAFGDRVAKDLTTADFEPFMAVEKGRIQRNRQLAVLSSAFTRAVFDWQWLTHNVCMQVPRHPVKKRHRYVAADDVERFKALAMNPRGRWGDRGSKAVPLTIDLALATGMRQGEILGLRWSDVDRDAKTLSYRESTSGKIVTIPLTADLRAILDECRSSLKQGDYVITQRAGRRYTGEGFRAVWQRLMRKWVKDGNKRITFHDIRGQWGRDRKPASATGVERLIGRLVETPGVELKQWMDITDGVARANVARHLAALANYGGGRLIFGFRKDGTLDPNHPGDLSPFNHDAIASIVDKFLTPPFHCEVLRVIPEGASDPCAVIGVPSHGPTPVCAKAGGPQDAKGRPQGITSGQYYTRVNGPKSEPIKTPEQWAPIIRRCVMNERKILLDNIAVLLRPPEDVVAATPLSPGPKRDRRTRAPNERGRVRMGQRRRRDAPQRT
jgi:integrase